jgi:uncharacterized membrane protein YkvA (DUF1232 family)
MCLQDEAYALYLACRHPGAPWYAKVFAACVVAYAFSPIDLIPDVVPVLGYLDDLVLVPLGIAIALRMIPQPVMNQCREEARDRLSRGRPRNWLAATAVIAAWLLVSALAAVLMMRVI